jgi:hypothetical protein
MVRILDTNLLRDQLELLSSRVSRREMALHVLEQARHLTKYVAIRCEGEEVSLGSIEIAPCPLNKRSIAEDAEASGRIQLSDLGRLPGRIKVTLNRLR